SVPPLSLRTIRIGSVTVAPSDDGAVMGAGVGGAAMGGLAGRELWTMPTRAPAQPAAICSAAVSSRPAITVRDTGRTFPRATCLTRDRRLWSRHRDSDRLSSEAR